MSQFTHSLGTSIRSHSTAVIAALIALVATTAVVLVLVIGDDSAPATDSVVPAAQSVRPDGGPEESNVASAVGSGSGAYGSHPDEAGVADAISGR